MNPSYAVTNPSCEYANSYMGRGPLEPGVYNMLERPNNNFTRDYVNDALEDYYATIDSDDVKTPQSTEPPPVPPPRSSTSVKLPSELFPM